MSNRVRYAILGVVVIVIVATIYLLDKPSVEQAEPELVAIENNIETGVKKGNIAPNFLLNNYQGDPIELYDFRGKYVLLNFWASWCPFCINEMPEFQIIQNEFSDDLVVVGVNREERLEKARVFSEGIGITYTLLLNESDSIYKQFQGGRAMPYSLIIDPEGKIIETKSGVYILEELRLKFTELTGK